MAHPFVKWAGGKTQLLQRLHYRMPEQYNDYYEPFVGGGAMMLSLAEQLTGKSVVINDVNRALINTYSVIKTDVDSLIEAIGALDEAFETDVEGAKAYYYEQRIRYNELLSSETYDVDTAALFIWINKHAFNGLYRVNSKGGFNVPWNQSTLPCLDEKNLRAVSEVLQTVEIRCGDFADVALLAQEGDFVFLDSPYVPVKADSFTDYTKDGFTYEDHVRLSEVYKELDSRGVYVMETNHDVELIHELYGKYRIESTAVKRMINSDASKRTGREVIITNYDTGMNDALLQ